MVLLVRVLFNKINFFGFCFSPPDVPEHLTSSHEFHRLHPNNPNIKISTNTLINDDHNGSFEDEENDEHFHPVDQPDGQTNTGTIIKAYALYDFNGRKNKHFFSVSMFVLRS